MTQSFLFVILASLPMQRQATLATNSHSNQQLYAGLSGSADAERKKREIEQRLSEETKDWGSPLSGDQSEGAARWRGGMARPSRDTRLEEQYDRVRDSGCKGISQCYQYFEPSQNVEDRRPASEPAGQDNSGPES